MVRNIAHMLHTAERNFNHARHDVNDSKPQQGEKMGSCRHIRQYKSRHMLHVHASLSHKQGTPLLFREVKENLLTTALNLAFQHTNVRCQISTVYDSLHCRGDLSVHGTYTSILRCAGEPATHH
jgi:hypothetical protein